MANRIQLRRDTAANWLSTNPVLADGEPGLEYDTGKIKYGDGNTNWFSLAYASSSSSYSNSDVAAYLANYDGELNFTASPAIISGVETVSTVNANVSQVINITNVTTTDVTSVLTHGWDPLFQLTSRNGVNLNDPNTEIARFGTNYVGEGWGTYTSYIRGSNAQDSYQQWFAGNALVATFGTGGIDFDIGGVTFPDNTTQTTAFELQGLPPSTAWGTTYPAGPGVANMDYQFFFDGGIGYPTMQSYASAGGNPLYNSIWSVESVINGAPAYTSSGATPVQVNNTGGVGIFAGALSPGDYVIVRIQNLDTGKIYRATFMGSYFGPDVGNEVKYGSITVERLL